MSSLQQWTNCKLQIEEDGLHEDQEDIVSPFEAGAAVSSSEQAAEEPIIEEVDSPQIKVVRKTAGGEQGFNWSEYEDVEEAHDESQITQLEQPAEEEPRNFHEIEIENESNGETRIAEAEFNDETNVDMDEVDNADATVDNEEATIEVFQTMDENETQEVAVEEQETREVCENDEVKSEKSAEEEYDRENDQEEE